MYGCLCCHGVVCTCCYLRLAADHELAHASLIAHDIKTCADELSSIAIVQALKTCANEISPVAQALKTCGDHVAPIVHPGPNELAHVARIAHPG